MAFVHWAFMRIAVTADPASATASRQRLAAMVLVCASGPSVKATANAPRADAIVLAFTRLRLRVLIERFASSDDRARVTRSRLHKLIATPPQFRRVGMASFLGENGHLTWDAPGRRKGLRTPRCAALVHGVCCSNRRFAHLESWRRQDLLNQIDEVGGTEAQNLVVEVVAGVV